MKETVNANIGSIAFTIDRDAYQALEHYFREIRRRLPDDDTETMGDIESRVAEFLAEKVPSPMHVVPLEIVRATMARLGAPSDFGEPHDTAGVAGTAGPDTPPTDEEPRHPVRRLYRSRRDRSIAGICGGLGDYFDADPTMIRLIMLLLILFGGLSIWAYVILWIVIPEEPTRKFNIYGTEKRQ